MRITAEQLNRATLARQLLLSRQEVPVAEAVRRIMAVQAQEAASPYLALWNRVTGFDPTELDKAFAEHTVVKATLMRMTLHAVHVDDYAAFHDAMRPMLRAARVNDRRFAGAGLTDTDLEALLRQLRGFAAVPRTNAELDARLRERSPAGGEPGPWWALRAFAPLWHAPTGGPWAFGLRPAYVAARTPPSSGDPAAPVKVLVRRYLEAFGPASAADVAQFAQLPRTKVRGALESMDLEVLHGPHGEVYDVPGGPRPDGDTPAPPRLMAMWDSVLLAYADRTRVVPADYRPLVTRRNGDVLPTLLVDGHVAGVWRAVDDGIEATAFHALPEETWAALGAEARSLLALLAERDPRPYRRYRRWWDDLPGAEVRVLPDQSRRGAG